MSRPRSIADDDSSLIPTSQFQWSSYTHLCLSSRLPISHINPWPVPVTSAPRFLKQTSAFAKTNVRIDERTCKICPKTGCKCVYKLKLRSRIIDMTFNTAELTPFRVTQTDAVLVFVACFSQRRTELYWKLKGKINLTVQYSYEGISRPSGSSQKRAIFVILYRKNILTIPVDQLSQYLPDRTLPNLQEW